MSAQLTEYFIRADGTAQLVCSQCGSPRFRFINKEMGSVCSNCGFPIVDEKRGW